MQKNTIANKFHHAAKTYDKAAVLQNEVANRLFERFLFLPDAPSNVLDIGTGTGKHAQTVFQHFPHARVYGIDIAFGMLNFAQQQHHHKNCHWVQADAEHLPFKAASFDLIIANMSLHWCQDLPAVFSHCFELLKPEGYLLFSMPGPDTLIELKQAFKKVDSFDHANYFFDMHDIGDMLLKAHFSNPVMDRENITLHYNTLKALLRELKATGASIVQQNRQKHVLTPNKWQQFEKAYAAFQTPDALWPATYEIITGFAMKALKSTTEGNEVKIPLEMLQNKL